MRIGLIDVDGHRFPNIPLMKISAWHKAKGDHVEWYEPMFSGHMDIVYMSKVFSFSEDYEMCIDADKIITGGSGYAISLEDGREIYRKEKDIDLPPEIERMYPDYSIYKDLTGWHKRKSKQTAYGYLTKGCPRGCDFCHVEAKEGRASRKVANLRDFWNGQGNIVLCDPNILACKEWKDLIQQLIDSGAWVDINQGLDIRLMTEEKAEMLKLLKIKKFHFAWDRYQDKDKILPKFQMFKEITGIDHRKLGVYVLCNFDTTIEQDLERIYILRDMGYQPYVMLYDKEHIPRGHKLRKMARWCNNRWIFAKVRNFEEYQNGGAK